MTELTTAQQSTALTIDPRQTGWTDEQAATLRHMGVSGNATRADAAVFFHVVKQSGLDPFARQIYMIERQGKQTIQTGIDGFRLIGHRAARATGEKISIAAPQWAHEDGTWRDLWTAAWGIPLAARITITRGGEPYTAVAMYDEYVARKRDGEPNSMWTQRPAGQLAKCAEALAWRMAFPQDLSGLYTDDELQHADADGRSASTSPRRQTAADLLASPPEAAGDDVEIEVEDPPADLLDGSEIAGEEA
jgi:phage recombination protein Bet